MIDIKELRMLAQAATPGPWMIDYVGVGFEVAAGESVIAQSQQIKGDMRHKARKANAAFIAAANPAAISEILDRLEAAEKERDALRAKIVEMERQEPVAKVESWTNGSYTRHYKLKWLRDVGEGAALYALPGAQGE